LGAIEQLDKALLVYLNNLGSPTWDGFWELMTDKITWVPLYIILLLMLILHYKNWKTILAAIVSILLIVLVVDQSIDDFFKPFFKRARPCDQPDVFEQIRLVMGYCKGQFGFFSTHAGISAGIAAFGVAAFRKYYKWFAILLLFYTFLHGYSRIYLAKHYPGDVLTGWLFGAVIGLLLFFLFSKLISRWQKT